jgi:hypothetical protein
MTGVGVNLFPFDIMSIGGIMEYDFKMTIDEADTLYAALKFYLDTHKERVNKLRNVDRDSLNDNDFVLVCNYDSALELINKFGDVESKSYQEVM